METNIITISREFGSGGRTVGKDLAERLGWAYYDKEIIKQVAVETGFNEEFVAENGEYAPTKNLLSYILSSGNGTPGIMNGLSVGDFIWAVQSKVITNIAEKGSCVIVGRCADYVLRNRGDCLNIFIHADMGARAERIVRLYGESEKSPEKRLEDKDKARRVYCKRHTGLDWGMSQNYNLSLDSSKIGIEKCADIVYTLVKETEQNF